MFTFAERVMMTGVAHCKILPSPWPTDTTPWPSRLAWYDWWDAQGQFFTVELTPDGQTRHPVAPVACHRLATHQPRSHSRHPRLPAPVEWDARQDNTVRAQIQPRWHLDVVHGMVEKRLYKMGTTRHDLDREAFTEKVWEWKEG